MKTTILAAVVAFAAWLYVMYAPSVTTGTQASALQLNVFNSPQCQDILMPEPMTFSLIALGGTLCLLRRR